MARTVSIRHIAALCAAIFGMAAAPLAAQPIETVDPTRTIEAGQIDGDIEENPGEPSIYGERGATPAPQPESQVSTWTDMSPDSEADTAAGYQGAAAPSATTAASPQGQAASEAIASTAAPPGTWQDDDLIGAAQGFFGENAEGIARMIERILADQGTPNGYIVGREASGAFIVGARYGSGTLYHKVEGQRPVYWTGPSIGFDVGANGGKTFVLVYNLFDTEQLYERFPAGEGQAYLIGGLTASYLRKGDTVLIPIRMGAGLRLGINAGYMKFSKEHRWLPF
ncbi:DUF1134 domain-containing protein [Alteriqipengyuania lutimaris]|uniref:DUF1134 domain-containing protein n=1 Tax=Alteriqipengyuania lutimaris TaxID=1538146 RepID=A0A395LRY8_9SPHN|nr:DUF1134 domain-containing protein [Alteriqipengyuania lutimaris]MBB3033657.1 hypothetical protein [Alteriqipengyuania lutimaris]RDS77350.1 DUF1134 domain-containing protein [Alteriqipengyuania lutimaris]